MWKPTAFVIDVRPSSDWRITHCGAFVEDRADTVITAGKRDDGRVLGLPQPGLQPAITTGGERNILLEQL